MSELAVVHYGQFGHILVIVHKEFKLMVLCLIVSRESGAPADQVEETPGRASLETLGCRTPPQLHAGGVGRQQQQQA